MDEAICKVVRTESDWAALVEACRKSGQSAAVFCRGQGVGYSLFLYHRSKILKNRCVGIVSRQGHGSLAVRRSVFMPVHVSESMGVRLKFPRGLVVESNELPEAAWLVEVALRWNDLGGTPC